MLVSIRDMLHIAFFQVIRAIRTRTILFLSIIYLLLSTGTAWITRGLVHQLEIQAANTLRVPQTKTPGAMIETLRQQESFRSMISSMIPDSDMLEWALSLPVLTIFHFWMSLIFLPFIVTVIGAEVISPSINDRSLRYEVLRTGRLELIFGRFLGRFLGDV